MGRNSLTKDENFLLKLYEHADGEGDLHLEVDFIDFGRKLSENDRTIKNIVKELAHANFVKKIDNQTIKLTQNGINFAQKYNEGWVS